LYETYKTTAPKEKPIPKGEGVTVNFEGIALPAFINAVYGDILKRSFEIAPELLKRQDLVTLRVPEPIPRDDLDTLARQVLRNYGVAVEQQGVALRFFQAKGAPPGEPPLIISGRALPEAPVSHRPIFQLVPLKAVRNTEIAGMLKGAFRGQNLTIDEDPTRNAILLMGPPEVVQQAVEAVLLFDQPFMRGRTSVRIDPAYLSAQDLSKQLVDVLRAEGYAASLDPTLGAIVVMPVAAVNAVLVFASDPKMLSHAVDWVRNLDTPGRGVSGPGIFYYYVKNTRAAELAKVLDSVLSQVIAETEAGAAAGAASPAAAGGPAGAATTQGAALSRATTGAATSTTRRTGTQQSVALRTKGLAVDDMRNAIIFYGESEIWERLLPIIARMDQPARMVLIEVTVAEVTLNNQEELGIEWLINDLSIGEYSVQLGTLGSLGVGTSGLNGYLLNNAGATRAVLNAFASKSRVKILSTPRVMVKSGATATVDVGTEVPIITSQATSSDLQEEGTSAILQSIQYRRTGVLLAVSPVIHSGNRVDLELSQEVSEAQPSTVSDIDSPSIFTRRIETSLSLKDGGSVLIGGLISSTLNNGSSGVPGLSKVPVLGRLFRVDAKTEDRTELVMLIVPYVIENDQDAIGITESLKDRLSTFQEVEGSL
jgi:general secretion pathway protein D